MTDYSDAALLQNLVLQPAHFAPDGLYFSGKGIECREQGLRLKPGGSLDFTGYFNLFSWDKWQRYTGIDSLSLFLNLDGACDVIFRSLDENGAVLAESGETVLSEGEILLDVPAPLLEGCVTVELRARDKCHLRAGSWMSSSVPRVNEVRIAIVFCTYNRDEYLFDNLDLLRRHLTPDMDVVVVDNASRIPAGAMDAYGPGFHLFHNPNTGGSGGFTRGIMEALKSSRKFTHVLLMDDDIRLEPESILRSEHLLRILKPEYSGHFLSGAMLQLDQPHLMFESTACWNGFRVKNHKRDLNLLKRQDLCRADRDESPRNQYAAWWYCAIPLSEGIREDLPFPFFLYGDDMDYSLRRAKGFLTLKGIGVWHEPFTKKFSPLFKSYFFCRNTLILNGLHADRFRFFHTALNGAAHFYVQLFVHDYRSAELALDALEDFLEGAEYVTALNEAELIRKKNRPVDFRIRSDRELRGCYAIKDNFNRFRSPLYFLHRKLAAYGYDGESAEIRRRSWRRIFPLMGRRFVLVCKFVFKYREAVGSYRKLHCGETFWLKRFTSRKEIVTNV